MATRTKASRSAAAKKAAATRKRNAAKRSAAAKKAAATRKRNGAKRTAAKRTAAKRGTKASRSAAAKKAAATRKRNAAKRSAAAKKAAATRKRNGGKRKASTSKRGTKASRSAAAKKAAATRKRNAARRSRAAKKAAATRKRKGSRKTVKSRSRPTAAKRRAAAKKAAATRKRNAAKRSRAAKKAAATRKRNSGKRRGSRRSRAKTATKRSGKSTLYNAFMAPINDMPGAVIGLAYAAALGGAYAAIKPMVWGRIGLTGANGYIAQAANMMPVLTDNMKTDLANFGNKALDLGTIGAASFLLSDKKKGLGLLSKGQAQGIMAVASTYYALQLFGELQTYNIGGGVRDLLAGNGFTFGQMATAPVTYGTIGSTGMMHGNHNYSMGMSTMNNKFFGVHNGGSSNMMLPAPAMNNGIVNTAATRGTAGNAIFGTRRGLGSSRVNLF